MPDILAELRRELSTAYRIVANEGILDAFGHISGVATTAWRDRLRPSRRDSTARSRAASRPASM